MWEYFLTHLLKAIPPKKKLVGATAIKRSLMRSFLWRASLWRIVPWQVDAVSTLISSDELHQLPPYWTST
jgi:hypothetical protein